MGQDTFEYHNGAVDNNTKVYRSQTHQVSRDIEQPHHNKGKQHGQRNDRSDNKPRAHIAQEYNQYDKYDNSPLYQIMYDSRDISIDQSRTVQIRFNTDTFRQYLLYFLHPFLQLSGHYIGIGPFKHHGNAAHTLSFTVHRHGTEALGRAKPHCSDITYMNGNPVTVGYDYLFNILNTVYHTLGTNIISTVHLFYIAASGVLIILVQSFKNLSDCDIQREKDIRVYRYLILFQIAAETIDFHNARNAGQLPLHNPILNGAKLHRIILVFISRSHFQHILINFAKPRSNGHQLGCTQFGWNLSRHSLYLFIDQLPGIQCRHIFFKDDRNHRKSETRYRTDFRHIHNVTHGNFHGHRDELLHFLRCQSGRHRHYLHLIIGNIGHCIYGKRQHGINSTNQKKQSGQPHKEFLFY